MKKMCIPGFVRWKWIKASSRDNARTPVQWDAGENAGFSGARPWLGINSNYRHINFASQKNDSASILNFYKSLIALRQKTRCLIYGEFIPCYADKRLMVYQRRLDNEVYTVALNFSSAKVKLPKKAAGLLSGALLVSGADRTVLAGELYPWEGALLKG